MSKATQDTLALLHQKVAEKLLKLVEGAEVSPQELAQAIKFLKDNNIQADPDLNEAVMKLAEKVDTALLPFPVSRGN